MKIRVLGSAGRDLIEGHRFYEKQAIGVGGYFLDPFAVYYLVEEETVLVYAVLDCRRNPAWIRKRLG